jgi:hypothetical protein
MKEIVEALDKAMPAIARRMQNELVLKCPVDQGRLRNSIKVSLNGRGLLIWMVNYGKYVEFGTPPHVIRPHNKKALKFEIGKTERLAAKGKNKNIVFAKVVRHPGTRPNPFVRNAIQTKLKKIIIEEINNNL